MFELPGNLWIAAMSPMTLARADPADGVWALLFVPVILAFVIASLTWRAGRKKTILEQWAANQGVRILECEERWLARGPFFFTTSKGQVVYRIAVEYPDGRVATGWLRSGGRFFGLMSDHVDVRWDKEKPHVPGFPVILPDKDRRDDSH